MGNRTIKAPGVEIIEHDLSGYTTTNLGTGCLITGFAQKGEDLVPMKITNRSSWLLNFGAPTNEAEEYFYNAGMEVLNQGGFLWAAKIPYSNDIAGIYAAAKFKVSGNYGLYRKSKESGEYIEDELDEDGNEIGAGGDDETLSAAYAVDGSLGRFCRNYRSLKELGINHLQLIAPAGNEFISNDLVEEYETGESEPGANTIYLVDKTRAIYTRTTEIADKQDNRDSRYCIGIVPVLTTLCNTAYFQSKSTGVVADVPELYQPVRSLKTITFPAGAASAAEYQPTKFTKDDLHTPLMKEANVFETSLSERAAMIGQSCLVNGNLVDGKFKPYVCNDVCVVVFKAFVSTEDGKIEFEPVETFVGSLDPKGRNEKGLTTFIDTIINNNSEYIYCFSNLENPEQVLNPDHGFVVGSDSEYSEIEGDLEDTDEYIAATEFSAYAAQMLGFSPEADDETGIAGALKTYYNQDAKAQVCVLDELVMGGNKNPTWIAKHLCPYDTNTTDTEKYGNYTSEMNLLNTDDTTKGMSGYMHIPEKFIVQEPTISYTITPKDDKTSTAEVKGDIGIVITRKDGITDDDKKYLIESYEYTLNIGTSPTEGETYRLNCIEGMELGSLNILNSTDYIRAILNFDELIDLEDLSKELDPTGTPATGVTTVMRKKAIQALILSSIEKSGRFKIRLRNLKKSKINLDKLEEKFKDYWTNYPDNEKREVSDEAKYIKDLYNSYFETGLLSGIYFVHDSTNEKRTRGAFLEKDALEKKLDDIVNATSRDGEGEGEGEGGGSKEGEPTKPGELTNETCYRYLKLKAYLNSVYYKNEASMLEALAKILEDCSYAQKRYVESQRNIDDSNIMLGFYPEMAEPIITYTTIAQSLNKIFDTMSDIHTSDIDVVCDAGISNIAQFVKQVYDPSSDDGEDVGGLYQPVKYSAYFKFNKNTDLAYWKTIIYKFDTFCKFRGDCMFCADGPRGMVLIGNKQVVRKSKKDTSVDLNILPYLSKIAGINTSYGAGYLNWYRTISDYTGDTLWVPPSIKAMGTYILTDKQYNWWDAPAGMRRGVINMVETSFNPTRLQAGEIYDVNWNYAIHYINDGIIQEGQKTFQTRQSALDRVNVRRLIGRIKRYVYFASRQFLYEAHTKAMREKYVKTLEPFFQDLVNRGGLYDFKIICDATNNTPEVIDRNELRVKIGIKPVKTIEFIIIDLCVLNTGASWTEMDAV